MLSIQDWPILIVDDEPDNLRLLQDILLFFDANVTSAASGQQAIETLQTGQFKLVLLDIQMARVSGFDVIKFIREHSDAAVRAQLVIAVTAEAMPGDRERILAAGFDGYVSKPIDAATFLTTIEESIASQKGSAQPPYVP